MRSRAAVAFSALAVLLSLRVEARNRSAHLTPQPEPAVITCDDGKNSGVASLSAKEVEGLVHGAEAAVDSNTMTIAVVDRAGRVLALYRQPGATAANDELAVGLARTAAFFSNNMAPLSSRTVRFISGVHFPAGVKRAGNAALYGIENTNRGCDFNATFNPGKLVPRATSLNGKPCNAFDASGCGTGIVTGKPDDFDLHEGGIHPEGVGLGASPLNPEGLPVNPGGIPVFRVPKIETTGDLADTTLRVTVPGGAGPRGVVGGIGVAGVPPDQAEFAAFASVAFSVTRGDLLFPAPQFPLPEPGRVFIDGIRLPFVDNGVRPDGIAAGSVKSGTFVVQAVDGGCVANRYLVGPLAGKSLSQAEVDTIVHRAVDTAQRTRAYIRLPLNSYARMVIAVADTDGALLALYRMPDATVFSIDVAVAKSRNVVYFSGGDANVRKDLPGVPAGTSINNRTLGYGGQPLFPAGIDFTDPGPFFDLFRRDLHNPCSQGFETPNANQNGIVFFPGSTALYKNGQIVGGLGVSGDGVEQDDYVTFYGAGDFRPSEKIWADRVFIDGVRLPFFKFPRHPEGVTEDDKEPF